MAFRFRRKMILAKVESTYATDPTPVQGTNAILTSNLSIEPYGGNTVSRNLDNANLGLDAQYNVGPMVQIEFDVEIAGSSALGVVPEHHPLFSACGLADTIVATTSVQYDPISTGFESCTIYINIDGQQQIITGCRGSLTMTLARGTIPKFHFVMTGKYAKPTAVAMYSPTFTNFKVPVPVNQQNTGTVTIHTYSAIMESIELNMNAEIVHRNLPGSDTIEFVDRAPSGQLVIEAPTLAQKDFFAATEAHAGVVTAAVSVVHGPAGNRFTFAGTLVQLTNLKQGESDGIMNYTFDAMYLPSDTGDDDFSFFFD